MELGKNIYQSTASYGRFMGKLTFYVCLIISIILLVVSIRLILKNESNLVDTLANIKQAECKDHFDKKTVSFNCSLTVTYKVNDTEYEEKILTNSNVNYKPNDAIKVTYDKTDPKKVSVKKMRSYQVGLIVLLIGFIVLAVGYYTKYTTENFAVVAAAQGTGSIVSLLTRGFRG